MSEVLALPLNKKVKFNVTINSGSLERITVAGVKHDTKVFQGRGEQNDLEDWEFNTPGHSDTAYGYCVALSAEFSTDDGKTWHESATQQYGFSSTIVVCTDNGANDVTGADGTTQSLESAGSLSNQVVGSCTHACPSPSNIMFH